MKKNVIKNVVVMLFFTTLIFTQLNAQTNDPILMIVNGTNITRSDFEYSFNKNNNEGVIDKKALQEYLPLYEAFCLKVEAAKEARIDTLSLVKKDLADFRRQMVYPNIKDPEYLETKIREVYDRTAAQYAGADILEASHILILVKQNADEATQSLAKQKVDSLYSLLQNGADFAEVAKANSQDRGSAVRGGVLGQFGKGNMIPEFEEAAYALQKGEISQPIRTTVGWHIIKLTDRHPFGTYEDHRDKIIDFLKQMRIQNDLANHYVDSIAKLKGVDKQVVIDSIFEQQIAENEDDRNLSKEYYDGTLMYEMQKKTVWDVAENDINGLEGFFKKNKKNYNWDEPHFKGVLIYAKNDTILTQAKKLAKKYKTPKEQAEAIVKQLNNDSVKLVRVEYGIYGKGVNQNVDVLAFGENKSLKQKQNLSAVGVVGKTLKAPKSYEDEKAQVVEDYKRYKETEWVKSLRSKYEITVNQDILNTINNHQ